MASNNEFYRLNLVLRMEDRLSQSLRGVDRQVQQLERAFRRAQAASSRLGNTNVKAVVHIDTTRIESALNRIVQRLDTLNGKVASPTVIVNDQSTRTLNNINQNLRNTTGRKWDIVLGLKDNVAGKLSGLKESLMSPMGMLGMGMVGMGAGSLASGFIGTYKDFEHQMKTVQAISGATGEELDALTAKAREMGAATAFSAAEAGKAFEYMAMAGWKPEQMTAAIQPMLNLAAAGGTDLGLTSDIVTDAMTAFRMDATTENVQMFTDVVAKAATSANTDVAKMGYTFQYLATTAGGLGFSIQDTALAIELVADMGIKGEKAGTGLLAMLNGLQGSTKPAAEALEKLGFTLDDGTGRAKPFRQIMTELREAFKQFGPLEQQQIANDIAGVDGMKAMMAMVGATGERFDEFAKGIDHASDAVELNGKKFNGWAERVAAIRMDSLEGDLKILESAWSDFQIGLLSGGGGDFLRGFVKSATETIGEFGELLKTPEFQSLDWGDKIVFLLDTAIEKINGWVNGGGGEQLGKVLTKLAEIGIRAFIGALTGLLAGAFEALMNGDIAGAAGLGFGAAMLPGAGLLAQGAVSAAKALFYTAPAEAAGGGAGGAGGAGGGVNWGRLGSVAKWAGRIAKPVQAAMDVNRLYESDDKVKTGSEVAGGWAGMLAGGKAGAAAGGAIGAAFGGVGAVPGAFIGGLLGSIGGYIGGSKLGGGIVDSARNFSKGFSGEETGISLANVQGATPEQFEKLANAIATKSNISADQLTALANIGAMAGMSVPDTMALLSTMSNNGIKGEMAGEVATSFMAALRPMTDKQMEAFSKLGLINEQGQNAFFDENGSMRSLTEIAAVLQNATQNMGQEERRAAFTDAFGKEGALAAETIAVGGQEAIEQVMTTPEIPEMPAAETFLGINFAELGEQARSTWDSFKEKAGYAWEGVKEQASSTWEAITAQGSTALESAGEWFNGVKDSAGKAVDDVSQAFSDAPAQIETFLNEAAASASNWLDEAGETLSTLPERAAYSTGEAVGYIVTTLENLPEQASAKFEQMETEALAYIEQTRTEAVTYLDGLKTEAVAYIDQLVAEADTFLSELPGRVSTWVEQTRTEAVTYLDGIATEAADYFNQLVTEADAYVSALPGMISTWMSETATAATNYAQQIITSTVQWFEQLPAQVSEKMSAMYDAVTNWASNIISSIQDWFSRIPGIIGGYFDSAVKTIGDKIASIKASFSLGFSAGSAEAGHAEGGIFNQEHIARFAEGNKPEAIIPLDISKRSRGLAILEQVQNIFGLGDTGDERAIMRGLPSIFNSAAGEQSKETDGEGFSIPGMDSSFWSEAREMLAQSAELLANAGSGGEFAPAMATMAAGGGGFGGGTAGGNSFNFSGINFSFGSDIDEEELAISIGRRFLAEIRQGQDNRG